MVDRIGVFLIQRRPCSNEWFLVIKSACLLSGECDPIAQTCEVYNGQAPRKKTFMIHWQCDGENDCGNGFDEAYCDGKLDSLWCSCCWCCCITSSWGPRNGPMQRLCRERWDVRDHRGTPPEVQSLVIHVEGSAVKPQVIVQLFLLAKYRFFWSLAQVLTAS